MFKPDRLGENREVELKKKETKILISLFFVLLTVLLIVAFSQVKGTELADKTKLSLRGKVVTEQFADVRDQRCFETLQSCQSSLAKLALSFRPTSEREATLNAEIQKLKSDNELYLKMLDCWQKNRSNTVNQDVCLSALKK